MKTKLCRCDFNLPKSKVDILILGEFPTEYEISKNKLFCDNEANHSIRNILDRLSTKYKFSYHLSTVYKRSTKKLTPDLIAHCSSCLQQELNITKPKVIVTLGGDICNYIYPNSLGILLEEGCVRNLKLFSKNYNIISALAPKWCLDKEPNIIGTVYTAIEKAILFTKDKHFTISNDFKSELITDIDDVKYLLKDFANTNEYVAVDTETSSLNRIKNDLLSIQLSNDGKTGYLIPIKHFDSPFDSKEIEIVLGLFKKFFTKESEVKGYIYHNPKFDLHQFYRELKTFIFNAPIIDTAFMEYLLEENYTRIKSYPKRKGPYSLFNISYRYGFNYYKDSNTKDDRDNLANLKIKDWLSYGCADVVSIFNIYKKQLYLAKVRNHTKIKLMSEEFSTSVVRTLTYVEHCGIPLNINTLREMTNPSTSPITIQKKLVTKELHNQKSVKKLNDILIKKKSGSEFSLFGNPIIFDLGSRLHREQLFYSILNLQPLVEGKLSVDKAFFKRYKDSVKEAELIAEFQRLRTLQSGQIDNIYDYMNKTTGEPDFYIDNKIRASYLPRTVTGRLRAFKPNPQQRVTRGDRAKDILKMYEARPDKFMLKMDQGTFEVRGLGIISGDKILTKNFNQMDDTYNRYRKNPTKFVDDITNPINLGTHLLKVINKKEKWLSEKLVEIITKEIDKFDRINKDIFKDVKSSFTNYVVNIIKKRKGWISSDVEQKIKKAIRFELRRLVSLNKVGSLTDIHKFSASLFNNIDVLEVTKVQRQNAKGLVFGSIYGRSPYSIAQELGITQEEAEALQEKFASNMPQSYEYLKTIPNVGYENLYVESPIGRRRHVWGFLFVNQDVKDTLDTKQFYKTMTKYGSEQSPHIKFQKKIFKDNSRLCMNAPNQGMCSDYNIIGTDLVILKINSLGKLLYQVPEKEAWMIHNLVHDSMEGEFPKNDYEEVVKTIEPIYANDLVRYIEDVYGFKIHMNFRVDFEFGLNYAQMEKWDGTEMELRRIKEVIAG